MEWVNDYIAFCVRLEGAGMEYHENGFTVLGKKHMSTKFKTISDGR